MKQEQLKMSDHKTSAGQIKYMYFGPEYKDRQPTGRNLYTVKLQFDESSEEGGATIAEIKSHNADNVKIIRTTENGDFVGPTPHHVNVSFKTAFEPLIVNNENQEVMPARFDSRTDSGIASVTYAVNKKDSKTYINLTGVRLIELDMVAKPDLDPEEKAKNAKDKIKALLAS